MINKNILILGSSGILGTNIINYSNYKKVFAHKNNEKIKIKKLKKIEICKFILNRKNLINFLSKKKVSLIINCMGLTNVEKCENNKNLSYKLNVNIPLELSQIVREKKIKLVHISTDHFLSKYYPISEKNSKLKSSNIYSRHKLIAEKKIMRTNKNSLIIRTNFFGNGSLKKKTFSETILDNLNKKKKVSLFKNVYFTPIYLPILVKIINNLIKKNQSGIFNICSNETVSKYEFGKLICRVFNRDTELVKPIALESKKKLVKRPHNMSLDNLKLKKKIKISIPSLKKQIIRMKKDFKNEKENSLW